MPSTSDTVDFPPKLKNGLNTVDSKRPSPVFIPSHQIDRQISNPLVTALSPPPGQLQHKKSHFRLRSDSGLALHTNQAGFRQYTHYNADGTVAARPLPVRTLSYDGNSSEEEFSLGDQPNTELKGLMSHGTLLPDFFEPPVIKLAFSNPETGQKLRKFAETRLGGTDIDFMLKVEEYSRGLGDVIASMSHISKTFTGTTATSPLGLPLDVANALRSNTKYCARTALPALDRLYQDAKASVEERLSQHLYPEFVKYQLSQCLTASLSASSCVTGDFKFPYPGLGDAFCLSDPLLPDNPLVYASDGLLAISGLRRHEITGKNGRVMQGIATDTKAARRLSEAVTSGREVTELILNYRSDGTPFWNFLFLCPLMENGSVRFFFGAQVNVSDKMGHEHKDILSVLNFGPPPEDFHPFQNPVSPTSSGWPLRPSCDTVEPYHQDDQASEKRAPRRPGFFSRFRRKSTTSSRAPSLPRPSMSSERTTEDALPPPPTSPPLRPSFHSSPLSPGLSTHHLPQQHQPPQPQQLDEHSTPYARFFILRFTPPPSPSSSAPTQGPSTSSPSPSPDPKLKRPTLPIAFCSRFALAMLGLRYPATTSAADDTAASSLVGRGIFTVLPGLSRAWRGNVVGRLARGESVRAEMVLQGQQGRGSGYKFWGVDGGGCPGGGVGEGREGRPRRSETLERGAEFFGQVLKGGWGGGGGGGGGGGQGKMRRFVSSWVPLKDVEGKIGFVVLVLTPVVERGAASGS